MSTCLSTPVRDQRKNLSTIYSASKLVPQECPEVAPLVGNAAMRLLGRHVGESASDSGFSGGLRTEAVCQTKIDDLNRTGAGKHDVRRLDVAMSDLACVCRRKGHASSRIERR